MGKLAVPDYILNKPGPLTPAEYERIKLHASAGADILSSIEFPFPVVPIVRHHHENWDGTGYPDGLKGTDIPLGARILSVVDCFDALTSDRPYRPRFSDGTALEIVLQRRGVMYDPVVVDAFVRVFNQLVPRPPTGASDQRAPFLTTTSAGLSPTPASEHTSARLEEIAASSEETLTLFEISRGLAVSMSVSDALGVIAKHLRRVVPSTFCVLYLYDASADELVVGNAVGDTAGVFSGLRIPLGQRLTGWVAANRQTILNSDPMLDLGETARALEPPLRSAISTPLVTTNALVGVLTLYSSNRSAFSDDHRRILETIARQLSLVIAAAHDVDRGRSLLTRDDPGRLPGIDSLRAIAALVTDDDGKFEQACSVLCLDVSGVTELTRCAGRQAADQALAGIVSAIRRVLRSEDRLFRHRTGELVVFLPRTGLRTAQVIAERLGSRISQPGAVPVTRGTTLSVGTGVASAPDDAVVLDELIDQARLRAVSSKENRVRLGDSPTSVH
jgi:diguanylate cyclase (GGDEF)-like protein